MFNSQLRTSIASLISNTLISVFIHVITFAFIYEFNNETFFSNPYTTLINMGHANGIPKDQTATRRYFCVVVS